jgi:hypothetical protein
MTFGDGFSKAHGGRLCLAAGKENFRIEKCFLRGGSSVGVVRRVRD